MITVAGVTSLPNSITFTFLDLIVPPRVTSLYPRRGPTAGGMPLHIIGSAFNGVADVELVELGSSQEPTGVTLPCLWHGMPDMMCNNTFIR